MGKRASLIFTFLLITVSAFAAACGGGGGGDKLTIQEYFTKLEQIDQSHEAGAEPLRAQLGDVLENTAAGEPAPAELKDALQGLHDNVAHFVDGIDALDPPDEVQELHDKTVADIRAGDVPILAQAVQMIDDGATVGDINDYFSSDDVVAKADARGADCEALQKIADDNNTGVDLTC